MPDYGSRAVTVTSCREGSFDGAYVFFRFDQEIVTDFQ